MLPHVLKVLQVEYNSDNVNKVDVSGIKHLFSGKIQHNWHTIASPPQGNVELLIGSEVLGLHPLEFANSGNLHILRLYFNLQNSGYAIKLRFVLI